MRPHDTTQKDKRRKPRNGRSKHPLYYVRQMMIQRCHNPRSKDYARYGGRGIVVCERWRKSFDDFLADMGERPPGTTLGRIDNDGPYSPGNCRWETIEDQGNNTRQNRFLTHDGQTLTIAQWSRKLQIKANIIRLRLNYGWSIERILTTPARPKRSNRRHNT